VLKELKFLERLARACGVTLPSSTKKHFEGDFSESAEVTARKSRPCRSTLSRSSTI
jgi:hypothetical protein